MLLVGLHMRQGLGSARSQPHVCCRNKQQLKPSRHWLQGEPLQPLLPVPHALTYLAASGTRCAAQPEGSVSKQRQPDATAPRQPLETNVWAYKPAWCQPWSILGTGKKAEPQLPLLVCCICKHAILLLQVLALWLLCDGCRTSPCCSHLWQQPRSHSGGGCFF